MLRWIATLSLCLPGWGFAADLQSHCIALAEADPQIHYASLGDGLGPDEVRLNFVGHSTYLLETATGLSAATDFTGFVGIGVTPDVVTMNRAHSSHWTANPDPAIPHILRGWGEDGAPAAHRVTVGDDEMLVRNVTTDIRSDFSGSIPDGNSIFVFEVAGLCIGHLGHLHHEPSEQQYALMGRMDVVMAPVDGGMTLPLPVMIKVLKRVRAQLVLPMHWFGGSTLQAFAAGMADTFDVEFTTDNSTIVSLRDLPRKPTVRILQPAYVDILDE